MTIKTQREETAINLAGMALVIMWLGIKLAPAKLTEMANEAMQMAMDRTDTQSVKGDGFGEITVTFQDGTSVRVADDDATEAGRAVLVSFVKPLAERLGWDPFAQSATAN